jgi:VWFA-related protein
MRSRRPSPRFRLAVACAALAPLLGAAGARATEPVATPPLGETIAVRLVEVHVVVTDDVGRPLFDLPRDAFALVEDGRPAEISPFEPPAAAAQGAPRAPGSAAGAADQRAGLLVALFVDDFAVGSAPRAPLLARLLDELALRLAPADRVAIARFDGRAQERLAPTADRKAIRAAFEQLEPLSPARIAAESELRAAIEPIRTDAVEGPCVHGEQIARGYAESARREVEASAVSLAAYVGSLAGLAGEKSVLSVSDGPSFVPGLEALEHALELCSGTALHQGIPGAADSGTFLKKYDRFDPAKLRLAFAEYATEKLWRRVVGHANAVGVTLYAVQAGTAGRLALADARDAQIQSTALGSTAEQNRGVVLPLLAAGTGGRALGRGGDAARLVGGLVEDLRSRYTLAFVPAERARPGLRALEVRVDRPGVRLRYRKSYLLRRPQEEVAERLLAFLLRGEGRNRLALGFAPLRSERGAAPRLRLEIPLDRIALVDAPDGARRGSLVAYVALEDERGRISPTRHRSFEIAVPAGGPAPGERYRFDLELPSGAERGAAAVALVDLYSGEIAFARTALR